MNDEEIDTHIGNLDGKWSILFRACIGTFVIGLPFIIGFNVWVVQSLNRVNTNIQLVSQSLEHIANKDVYTKAEAELAMEKQRREIMATIEAQYPPKWMRDTVESHGLRLVALEMKIEK